ncbi:MAG: VOC family protein [Hamadaea sp.]|nr:VOC family protein [Hamadaea sp.]
MTSRIRQWTIDVHDLDVMAEFWSQALGYQVDKGGDGSAKLFSGQPGDPTVWLQPTAGAKRDKNRTHPDLNVTDGDVDTEVDRLLGLGARHADVGQTGEEGFVVLADPEGNEFCLLYGPPSKYVG